MTRRWLGSAAVLLLFFAAACSDDDKKPTSASAGSSASNSRSTSIVIEVDNSIDAFPFEALEYYPSEFTVAPGANLVLHNNFRGEPHTFSMGESIDQETQLIANLTPEEQQAGPSEETQQQLQEIGVPQVIDFETADLSDPENVPVNQSAAQPCVVPTGEKAPGLEACTDQNLGSFDGKQALWSTGLLDDDQLVKLNLSDDIVPGDYTVICLFHGPDMRATMHVAAAGSPEIQTAAQIKAAGQKQLDDEVAELIPAIAKAKADTQPPNVQAGVFAEPEGSRYVANMFVPDEVDVAVGATVTWNLPVHTVSFNAPQDATPFMIQGSTGAWKVNGRSVLPAGYTPPTSDADSQSSSEASGRPPPLVVDGGSFDGKSFYSSGSLPGDAVTFNLTFTAAGTFKYICLLHPGMEGTVKVG